MHVVVFCGRNTCLMTAYMNNSLLSLALFFVLRCGYVSADTVDSITPDKVRGLRDLLNSSAMDIMYYNSPLYRDEVRVIQIQ